MEGRIVGLNCGYYSVVSDGVIFKVKARGAFRNKDKKPVVGDLVELDDTYFVINTIWGDTRFGSRSMSRTVHSKGNLDSFPFSSKL